MMRMEVASHLPSLNVCPCGGCDSWNVSGVERHV
jgi:hypothetical protein